MGSVTIQVQMFQIFKFEICSKHVEKLCWKFQHMLKSVLKILMHVENVLKFPNYDSFFQFLCIIELMKLKTNRLI